MKKTLLTLIFIIGIKPLIFSQTLFINEICASNYISYADSTGDDGDWVEIYNGGGAAVDVGGMYITDDLTELTEFQISTLNPTATTIPAGGHLLFWFDDKTFRGVTHIEPKLAGNGEQVGLIASDGVTIIDSVTFGKQIYDVSYGRLTDGSSTWTYFATPTPRAANTGTGATGIAGNVVWNYDAGFYPGSIQVELTYPSGTASIYYSLNGNEPSPTRGILYTAPINVDTNATIRVRVYDTNLIPGEIKTRSFFINRPHDLPIIVITTDSANLWDVNTGIYAWGVDDYDHNYPFTGANFWEDWKRPAHMEMFETNDVAVVDQDLNLSIAGNTNRAYAQKSFDLESKSALGNDHITFPLFPQLPITSYKNLRLRNGGSDWSSTTIRDALNQTLLEGATDVDHQSSRPAVIYLNGQYWGILNMCEKITNDYLNEHFDYVDKDSVDLLEMNNTVIEGDAASYVAMTDYITANTMTNQANYNYVKTQMDVYNFTNYMETRIYFAATDWPSNNIKYWRPQNDPVHKWRWMMWDTDRSTLLKSSVGADHNTLDYATGGGNPAWSIFLINNLLLNAEFKSDFITQFAHHINFTFCPIRVDSEITGFVNRLTFEMPDHITKWKDSNNDLQGYYTQGYFQNMTEWNKEVDTIKIFFDNRAHYMRQFIMQKFGITDTSELTVNTSPVAGGVVYLDSFPVPQNVCKLVYFNGYPITMTAHANPGYVFSGWISAGGDTMPLTWNPNGDTTVTAYFTTGLVNEPTTAATNVTPSISNCTDVNLNWSSGNGASRMVVARLGSAVSSFPTDGTGYTANSVFGSGSDLGSGNYVVYSGSGNTCSITGLTAGSQYYFAIIEFNGSSTTSNYNTTSYLTTNITVNTFTVNASATTSSVCSGSSTTLSATGGLTYEWSPSTGLSDSTGASVTATPTIAITYTVDATNADGCHATTTVAIAVNTPPTVTLSNFTDACASPSPVTLTGGTPGGGTYNGAFVTTGTFDALAAGAGTHDITYSYTDGNGCSDSATSTINVLALPIVTLNAFSDVCADATPVTLSGGSPVGGTYSGTGVTGGKFDAIIAGVGTQTITYDYTDLSGCSNSATSTINVLALPIVTLNTFSDVCADATPVTLSGGTPTGGTYSGTGVTTGSFDPAAAGIGAQIITYLYTDLSGCSGSDTASILVSALPVVSLGSDTTICMFSDIQLDAGSGFSTYLWSTTETTQTILVDSSGTGIGTATYNVTVTNPSNCAASDDINVTFDVCGVNISDNIRSSSVIVYPNPFTNAITITSDENNSTIIFYDVFGKVILRKEMAAPQEIIHPDVSSGIYFLRIESREAFTTIKVVKTR